MATIYSTPKKFMFSFDDIIAAMVDKHDVNQAYGAARPGVMYANGTKVSQHDFEFLIGNQVARFSLADVEVAVSEHFELPIIEAPVHAEPVPVHPVVAVTEPVSPVAIATPPPPAAKPTPAVVAPAVEKK